MRVLPEFGTRSDNASSDEVDEIARLKTEPSRVTRSATS
jgi:hypothetical protein